MIDLKSVLDTFPECLSDSKKLKSILLDLYPEEKLYGKLLAQILDAGIVDELKNKDKIDSFEFAILCNRFVSIYAVDQKYVKECIEIWLRALGINKESAIKNNPQNSAKSTLHTHRYAETIIPPTCSEKGYTLHSCSCGYEYKDNFVSAKHDFMLIKHIAPTCDKDGEDFYRCSRCGEEKTVSIPTKGHKFSNWVEKTKPTCLKNGLDVRECLLCGKTESRKVSKTGHNFSSWRKNGDDFIRDCSNCGFSEKRGLPIERIGQIFEFGEYPQLCNNYNDVRPIQWEVLDIQDNKALLLSVYGLDKKAFDDSCLGLPLYKITKNFISWGNSSIRRWLNSFFYKYSFSDTEKEKILTSELTNIVYTETYPDMKSMASRKGKTWDNNTQDKIFLLSIPDVELYFGLKESTAVKELHKNVIMTERFNEKKAVPWLLRTNSYSVRNYSSFISYDYRIKTVHDNYFLIATYGDEHAIRPAMWVDLSTAENKEQKLKAEQERKRLEEQHKAEQARLERERAIKAAEEKKKEESLKKERREKDLCQYCGGSFKGLIIKRCSICGKRRDY